MLPSVCRQRMSDAVAMQSIMGRTAGMLLLFNLAACSGPPWTLSQSPEAIALRWYPDETTLGAADQRAEQYCRSWGKAAQLAADLRDGSAEVAQYRCR
jgi:hypothetical protein